MPRLTEAEKQQRAFNRRLEKAKEKGTQYYPAIVAKKFQLMIRAEAGAMMAGDEICVVRGVIDYSYRDVGEVICVTCGKRGAWKGGKAAPGGGMHTGHFIASRRNSILFEESNVAPQCSRCNLFEDGNQKAYAVYMLEVYGQGEIDRLTRLKHESVKFDLAKLVEMSFEYDGRHKAAVEKMKG